MAKNVTLHTNRSSEARTNRESVQQALQEELENLDRTFAHCAPVNLVRFFKHRCGMNKWS